MLKYKMNQSYFLKRYSKILIINLFFSMSNFLLSEYNVNAPPLLNEKVLKDKRKKLKETWDRVMRLYVRPNSYNSFI